jgi:uncharacterized protein YdaU (DUF1376 family)
MHLTLLEHGIYRQLLDWYYLEETPIPKNNPEVFRRLLARNPDEQETALCVLQEFFKPTENGWIHTRCDKEIALFKAKSDRSRENGKRGGRPNKPRKTQQVISGLFLETQKKANSRTQELINARTQEENTVAQKAQPTQKLTDAEWFDLIKGNYPHIDVEQESRKMDAWLSTRRGKQKTRRFVVNWLNRIDAPMQATVSTLPAEYAF